MAFGSFDKGNSSSHTMSEINMVPLIDVMLVLLVIFIITAPMLSHSLKINLPQVSSQPIEQEPKVIDLAVDEYGQVYWNEQAVPQESLRERFLIESKQQPQPDLRIRADLNTRYEVLAQVMSSARSGGMKRIGFVTRPGENSVAPNPAPEGDAADGQQAGADGQPGATPAAAGAAQTPAQSGAAASAGAAQPAAAGATAR